MIIIPNSSAEHLCKLAQSKKKNISIILPTTNKDGEKLVPDGEIYMKIPNSSRLKNKRIIVLHTGMPNPNDGLIEIELILQILKDEGAKPEIFFSYFPYGMQDSVFEKGETNIAENLIEKLINYYNIKNIFIIDAHFEGKSWTDKYPITNISALPLLVAKATQDFGKDILLLSPDIGGERRTGIRGAKKQRKNSHNVIFEGMLSKKLITNRVVAVVDDILETGGTLDKFYDECKKLGAKRIIALITHGVLPAGIARIRKKYDKLYLTNTIKQKNVSIDVAGLILEAAQ